MTKIENIIVFPKEFRILVVFAFLVVFIIFIKIRVESCQKKQITEMKTLKYFIRNFAFLLILVVLIILETLLVFVGEGDSFVKILVPVVARTGSRAYGSG